jgi:Zn-dependent protease
MEFAAIAILIVILIFSIILHELSHGYVALALGDPTARLAGRLTLNPIPHIDLLGSILLPSIMLLSGTPFLFGWAKPVPYNPYNLRNQKWGEALVAGAGPLTNLSIALVFSIILRLRETLALPESFAALTLMVITLNIVLAIINMIPIPPIDGSKVLRALLPYHLSHIYGRLEEVVYRLGPIGLILVLLLIIFVFGPFISTAIFGIVSLFTGLSMGEMNFLLQSLFSAGG